MQKEQKKQLLAVSQYLSLEHVSCVLQLDTRANCTAASTVTMKREGAAGSERLQRSAVIVFFQSRFLFCVRDRHKRWRHMGFNSRFGRNAGETETHLDERHRVTAPLGVHPDKLGARRGWRTRSDVHPTGVPLPAIALALKLPCMPRPFDFCPGHRTPHHA